MSFRYVLEDEAKLWGNGIAYSFNKRLHTFVSVCKRFCY